MEYPTRVCAWCADPYTPKRIDQKTCGGACSKRFNSADQNAKHRRPKPSVTCEACSRVFVRPRSDSSVCSVRCRNVIIARGVRATRIAERDPKYCSVCASDITHLRADAVTCSPTCAHAAYKLTRRDVYITHQQNREALRRKATVGHGVPRREWLRILHAANSKCFYCGSIADLTMDHVVPISRGGCHGIGNVVAACTSCNCSKNDRLLIEWLWTPNRTVNLQAGIARGLKVGFKPSSRVREGHFPSGRRAIRQNDRDTTAQRFV